MSEETNWGLLIIGTIIVLLFLTYSMTQNTKSVIEKGYTQVQLQGTTSVYWTKCK